jgi:hypothetical protein
MEFTDGGCCVTVIAVAMALDRPRMRGPDLASGVAGRAVALLPVVLNVALLAAAHRLRRRERDRGYVAGRAADRVVDRMLESHGARPGRTLLHLDGHGLRDGGP